MREAFMFGIQLECFLPDLVLFVSSMGGFCSSPTVKTFIWALSGKKCFCCKCKDSLNQFSSKYVKIAQNNKNMLDAQSCFGRHANKSVGGYGGAIGWANALPRRGEKCPPKLGMFACAAGSKAYNFIEAVIGREWMDLGMGRQTQNCARQPIGWQLLRFARLLFPFA